MPSQVRSIYYKADFTDMGGTALSTPGLRLDSKRYHTLYREFTARARNALPEDTPLLVVPSLYEKESFGDMDILVGHDDAGFEPERLAHIIAGGQLTEVVENGWVTSFGVQIDADQAPFQVDLLRVPPECFGFALGYFGFNDLGNILGRVARETGFKLGFRGLEYVVDRFNHTQQLAVLPVTLDWHHALGFLGYDPIQYNEGARGGFKTREDIFRFAASSPYFHPDIFHPDNAKSRDRTRDLKRPTYNALLKWLETHRHGLNQFDWSSPGARDAFMARAQAQFPHLQTAIDRVMAHTELVDIGRQKLSGERVALLTGRERLAIRDLLKQIDDRFGDRQTAHHWAGEVTQEHVDALILDLHHQTQTRRQAHSTDKG